MPHLDPFYEAKLRGRLGLADAGLVLDLRGLDREAAEARLGEALRGGPGAPATLAVRLSPPPEGGGETLFQPIGRWLLEAKRRGAVAHLATLPAEDGLGFHVTLAGGRDRAS